MQRFLEWSRQWFIIIALLAIIGLVGFIMLETIRTDGVPAAALTTPAPTIGLQSVIPVQVETTPLATIPLAAATPLVRGQQHTVRAGDTLFDLAVQYGTTMEAILAENPEIIDANDLELGQLIRIPPADSP